VKVVAFVPDLIDRSRITNAQEDVTFVDKVEDLGAASDGADMAIVDLSRDGAIEALKALRCYRAVGFANHTAKDLLEQARLAGAVPMVRSEFFIRLEELLHGMSS
jgi:hypothetical protein